MRLLWFTSSRTNTDSGVTPETLIFNFNESRVCGPVPLMNATESMPMWYGGGSIEPRAQTWENSRVSPLVSTVAILRHPCHGGETIFASLPVISESSQTVTLELSWFARITKYPSNVSNLLSLDQETQSVSPRLLKLMLAGSQE